MARFRFGSPVFSRTTTAQMMMSHDDDADRPPNAVVLVVLYPVGAPSPPPPPPPSVVGRDGESRGGRANDVHIPRQYTFCVAVPHPGQGLKSGGMGWMGYAVGAWRVAEDACAEDTYMASMSGWTRRGGPGRRHPFAAVAKEGGVHEVPLLPLQYHAWDDN